MVVSIPKGWVDQYNLTKGDELFFEVREDGSLLIYPLDAKHKRSSTITIKVPPSADKGLVERQLIACYLNNYQELIMESTEVFTSDQQEELRARLKELVGLQIIETSSKMIRIQSIVNVSDLNLERSLNRAHTITAFMLQDAIRALETLDVDLAKSIIKMDDDVNQFYFLILKQLQYALQNPIIMKELGIDLVDILSYYAALRRIEHIADQSKAIADSIENLKSHKAPKELIQLVNSFFKQAYDTYCQAVKGLSSKDINMTNAVINNKYRIRKEISASLLRAIGKDSNKRIEETKIILNDPEQNEKSLKRLAEAYEVYCMVRTIAGRVERITEFSADIAEVSINRMLKANLTQEA
ncbi:MAG: PhoU domain-containing protein [Candidatus Hodarchaeota archaeon]